MSLDHGADERRHTRNQMLAVGTRVTAHAYELRADLAHKQIFLVWISDRERSL
jgi:hypothetical protein